MQIGIGAKKTGALPTTSKPDQKAKPRKSGGQTEFTLQGTVIAIVDGSGNKKFKVGGVLKKVTKDRFENQMSSTEQNNYIIFTGASNKGKKPQYIEDYQARVNELTRN